MIQRDNVILWVLKYQSLIIGYACVEYIAGEGDVHTLAIHPKYRGHALGYKLLTTICQHAVAEGYTQLILLVRQNNLAAIGLYQKCGFQIAGKRLHYFSDNREDALLFRKVLA